MTIKLEKYVDILAGVGGTPAQPFVIPNFDTVFPALLLVGTGPLLLQLTQTPLLLNEDSSDG